MSTVLILMASLALPATKVTEPNDARSVDPVSSSVLVEQEGGTAEADDAAAEMARKLQDPLANIKMVAFNNDVLFNTGDGQESYSFNVQPVYAIPLEDRGLNVVLRGMFPILGMAAGSQKPIVPDPLPQGSGLTWGLGDSILQSFISPRTDSPWKWGVGPMVSLKTRTDSDLKGPGWGAGLSGVLVGNVTEQLSTSFLLGQLWGDESSFSTTLIQPMIFYNVESISGFAINYNNSIAYDWSATSGNAWTVPLGAGVSQTLALDGGYGLDLGLGYYHYVEKPEGAADWAIRWSVTFLLP